MKPLLLVVLAGVVASSAAAVPLNVVETTDFNGNQLSPTAVGTFDVGVNTVSGSVTGGGSGDSISILLPSGLQITAISLQISNFVAPSGTAASTVFLVSPFTFVEQQLPSGNGSFAFAMGLPFTAPDNYGFSNQKTTGGISFDWTWSVTVVPEPAGRWLFAVTVAALMALAWCRREGFS